MTNIFNDVNSANIYDELDMLDQDMAFEQMYPRPKDKRRIFKVALDIPAPYTKWDDDERNDGLGKLS
jgi:hypothetical protein